jgi:hypothetical protein
MKIAHRALLPTSYANSLRSMNNYFLIPGDGGRTEIRITESGPHKSKIELI